VVKFANNPQFGSRVLVNEYIAGAIFQYFGVTTPETAFVEVGDAFLKQHPSVRMSEGSKGFRDILPGIHLGSLYPGSPLLNLVYDFIPDALLQRVYNRSDFFGALVLDTWLGNVDARQTIFYRAAVRRKSAITAEWVVSMIDHGLAFGGGAWTLVDSPVQGLYSRRTVYGREPTICDCEPWLQHMRSMKREILEAALSGVPAEWIRGDEMAAHSLLRRLWERRERVPSLLARSFEWLQNRQRAFRP
jgi:hypothetical protein